jgi:hypothetical protein
LDYSAVGSSTVQTFWAFVEKNEGQFYTADIDLTPLVGQDLKFILTVLSAGSPANDRALWVAPIIYNNSSAPAPTATSTTAAASATPTVTNTTAPATATPTSTATPTATP